MKTTTVTKTLLCWSILCFILISIAISPACKKDDPDDMPDPIDTSDMVDPVDTMTVDTMGTDTMNTDTIVEPPMGCNKELRPIIMMHGFLGSGDTYANQVMRFVENGYCPEHLFAFDWNSLDQASDVPLLDAFIDEVLLETGFEKVDLAGHSAGGNLGYTYISEPNQAKKVAHYAHIGSFEINPSERGVTVPIINIWSEADEVVASVDIAEGAENFKQTDADHYEVATNAACFGAMYRFFNDGIEAATTDIPVAIGSIELAGKAVTFGENTPLAEASVEIYELDPSTGLRLRTMPDASFTADENGYWGPYTGQAKTTYEFVVQGVDDELPIHYFREGFPTSNPLIYLRTIPPPGSLAGTLLADLPKDDEQTLIAIFSSSQAVIHGRDQLTINDIDLATAELSPAEKTNIAYFLYDDGDQESSFGSVGLFSISPTFLTGLDVFFPTKEPSTIQIKFNGRSLNVPNLKSGTDGPVVIVLD